MQNIEKSIESVEKNVREHHEHGPHQDERLAKLEREKLEIKIEALRTTNEVQHQMIITELQQLRQAFSEMRSDIKIISAQRKMDIGG